MKLLSLFLTSVFIALLAGCASSPTPEIAPTDTPVPTLPAAQATPEPTTLTIWLPDWMAMPDAPGYDALMETITAFEQEKGIDVNVIPRLPSGKDGLLDALTITKPVAPSQLPDIVALPFQDVSNAVEHNLLQPLTDLFPENILEDSYPFAQQAGKVDDVWMAIPFAANFEHLSFQPAALSEPPVSWEIVLASGNKYAFPVGGAESDWTDALLLHYLSGVPSGESPDRNNKALKTQLAFYEALYQGGQVDESILQIDDPQSSWEQALQGAAPLAETTAHLWLAQRGETTFLRFGPTPSADTQARYLIHGWAYALITADENRQALAVDLINRLVAVQTLADWSYQSNVLPVRRSALQQWPADDFRAFSDEALENGFLMPAFAQDQEMASAVHQAVRSVLSGKKSADAAWQEAINAW